MSKSSISKLHNIRPNSQFAVGLGNAIRERRRARGMTQSELAAPFTKGFISEVERGHSLPSLRALTLVADRLGVSASELLDSVKEGLPWVDTPADEDQHASAPPCTVHQPGPRPGSRARPRAGLVEVGLTQQQLAGERYTRCTVSALENGLVRPSMAASNLFSSQLGVPPSHLIGDDTPALLRPADIHLAAGRSREAIDGYTELRPAPTDTGLRADTSCAVAPRRPAGSMTLWLR